MALRAGGGRFVVIPKTARVSSTELLLMMSVAVQNLGTLRSGADVTVAGAAAGASVAGVLPRGTVIGCQDAAFRKWASGNSLQFFPESAKYACVN